jgi:hypothetical protein
MKGTATKAVRRAMTIAKKVKTREPTLANINDLARFLASFCGQFVLDHVDNRNDTARFFDELPGGLVALTDVRL